MNALIVCVSISHGNTWKVAEAMAEALGGEIRKPEDIDVLSLSGYDLIGFGSGIFHSKFHRDLIRLVDDLPPLSARAFIFSTGGMGDDRQHPGLREKLQSKGMEVIGSFSCKGWDTYAPFKLVGGINKGRPNEEDLKRAREFAEALFRT